MTSNFPKMIETSSANLDDYATTEAVLAYSKIIKKWVTTTIRSLKAYPEQYPNFYMISEIPSPANTNHMELRTAVDNLFNFIETFSVRNPAVNSALADYKTKIYNQINRI